MRTLQTWLLCFRPDRRGKGVNTEIRNKKEVISSYISYKSVKVIHSTLAAGINKSIILGLLKSESWAWNAPSTISFLLRTDELLHEERNISFYLLDSDAS
jgi:hypothetical protein